MYMMNEEASMLPVDESFWVVPAKLRAGEYPGSRFEEEARGKLSWLINQGIRFFIDLTEPGEHGLKPYEHLLREEALGADCDVTYIRIPLVDYSKPSQEDMTGILNTIDQSLNEGKNVYFHCYGGKGRTGTVIGCYLVRHGMLGVNALEKIKELRKEIPGRNEKSPETEEQIRMVLEWNVGQ